MGSVVVHADRDGGPVSGAMRDDPDALMAHAAGRPDHMILVVKDHGVEWATSDGRHGTLLHAGTRYSATVARAWAKVAPLKWATVWSLT